MTPNYLRIAFTPGIAPSKWFQRFDERHAPTQIAAAAVDDPLPYVLGEKVDAAFVRLNALGRASLPDDLHCVELYDEAPGVAVPKEHAIAAYDEITLGDLADELILWQPQGPEYTVDIGAVRENLQVVAANVGVVIAPRPLLRQLNVRSTKHVGLTDGRTSRLALVWRKDHDSETIQDFVGICKGRTARTSR